MFDRSGSEVSPPDSNFDIDSWRKCYAAHKQLVKRPTIFYVPRQRTVFANRLETRAFRFDLSLSYFCIFLHGLRKELIFFTSVQSEGQLCVASQLHVSGCVPAIQGGVNVVVASNRSSIPNDFREKTPLYSRVFRRKTCHLACLYV